MGAPLMESSRAVQKILAVAVNAPSGDNAQPWRFRIEEDTISLFNIPARDATLYNFRERGSYLAHGALAENIVIAAIHEGYEARVTPFPGEKDCTARIGLRASVGPVPEPLYESISKRTTNRKPYDAKPLNPRHLDLIQKSLALFADVHLKLIEDRDAIASLAGAISVNERLLMENRTMHDFLFGIIRWSKDEERATPGLYIETMEFPVPLQKMFKYVLCHWPIVRFLNLFGLSKIVPKQSSQGYAASSAIGAIILREESDADFFRAGRAFERMWLTATSIGLSIQPVTAIPYLAQRVTAHEAEAFNREHQERIRGAYAEISDAFDLHGQEHIAMLFRVGYDGKPTAHSSKLPPVIL